MNTNPDETKLALWLDDELEGDELLEFEKRVGGRPEHLAAREEVRRWRALMKSAVPASEEPPYAELFNGRVARAIKEVQEPVNVVPMAGFSWRNLLMPLAACAGMVLTFWLGTRVRSGADARQVVEIDVSNAPRAIPVEPVIYTPERGVKAEWFTSNDASATVIVLDGVAAIPDEMDFSKTVDAGSSDGDRAMAGNEPLDIDTLGL